MISVCYRTVLPRWGRLGVVALLAAIGAVGCNHAAPSNKGGKPAEVVVTSPIMDEVTDYQDFTGRIDAFRTVEVRPHVSGYVVEAPFKEGDLVKEGDLLFQIDPRPFQADYDQAEATYKQAEADRQLQDKLFKRGREMRATNAIGAEELDQIQGASEKSTATAAAMKAARDRAKLYLDYTHVTAPVSGRVSRRSVDPGNLVNADQTVLTTVVAEDTVYAYFDVDERTYLDLVGASQAPESWFFGLQYPVLIRLANEEEFRRPGRVDFIDNRLNGNTGTVRMRAVLPNPDRVLKSGLFARVRLPIGRPYQAIIIPDEAVQSDQGRKFVYVVNAQNVVEYRTVELGQAIHDLRVIKKGLTGHEQVIVSGMQRVRAKSEVQVKKQGPPKPPHTSLGKLLTFDRPATAAGGPSGGKPAAAPQSRPAD